MLFFFLVLFDIFIFIIHTIPDNLYQQHKSIL